MEVPVTADDKAEISMKEPLLNTSTAIAKGGFKTLPSIIVNESLEKVASYGLSSNMTRYFTRDYGMSTAGASNVLFFWSAASNFAPVLGAFLADSCVGRFPMIGFGSIACLLGMILLWLTAAIPQAGPSCHKLNGSCDPSTPWQLLLLYSSLGLMSIGAGGLRSASLAFGADQLKNKDSPTSTGRVFESYLSWYYVSVTTSILIGMSVIVYIQDSFGWKVGFGVPVVLMVLSVIFFFASSSLYVKPKPTASLITGLFQVAVASYKKRHVQLSDSDHSMYHYQPGSNLLVPTEKLRFLNKACIIRNRSEEMTTDGKASDPWSLCTVEQVEELKALIKIIPIWSAGIIYAVPISQGSVSYLQVASMDRHITSKLEFPAGSFGTFVLGAIIIWVPIYDRILLPLASKIMRKPVRFHVKQKMGAGIIFMSLSVAVSAIVESFRRTAAIEGGFSDDPYAIVNMSAFWLVPRDVFAGVAEALNAIGQNEFYMSELPKSMSSIASSLLGLNMFAGNLIASLIMTSVDDLSKAGGRESWVSSNINKAHCDYYYWLVCGLNSANFFYFLLCCKGYGLCKDEEDESKSTKI